MQLLSIRRASLDDAAVIAAVTDRSVRVSNAADYGPEAIEFLLQSMSPDHIRRRIAERDVFVAVGADDLPVGTVSYFDGKLRGMFVLPEHQGSGLGRRLVDYLEAHARSLGIKELRVSSSTTARGFYRKLGYRELHEEPSEVTTWLMTKTL